MPAKTTEITYTGKGGAQVAIAVTHGKRGTLAHPKSRADVRTIDELWPTEADVDAADKADQAEEAATTETETPAAGAQEA